MWIYFSFQRISAHGQDFTGSANFPWHPMKEQRDPRQLWRAAINWNGTFEMAPGTVDTPSDKDCCTHYENLMNPDRKHPPVYQRVAPKYIPILDDQGRTQDLWKGGGGAQRLPRAPQAQWFLEGPVWRPYAIKSLNTNKAAGYDGVPPGLLKLPNVQWILLTTCLFNIVFVSAYPVQ